MADALEAVKARDRIASDGRFWVIPMIPKRAAPDGESPFAYRSARCFDAGSDSRSPRSTVGIRILNAAARCVSCHCPTGARRCTLHFSDQIEEEHRALRNALASRSPWRLSIVRVELV